MLVFRGWGKEEKPTKETEKEPPGRWKDIGRAERPESRGKGVFQRESAGDWVQWYWQVKSDKDRELLVTGFSKIKIISVFEKTSFTC